MKYIGILSLLALAAKAIAAPADVDTISVSACAAESGVQACCNSGSLGCLVQVLGSNCINNAYCCDAGASAGGLINADLLNCAKLLG